RLDGPLLAVGVLVDQVKPYLQVFQGVLVRRDPDPKPLDFRVVDHVQPLRQILPPQRAQAHPAPEDAVFGHGCSSLRPPNEFRASPASPRDRRPPLVRCPAAGATWPAAPAPGI